MKAPFRHIYRDSLDAGTADELIDGYFRHLEAAPGKTAYTDMIELLAKYRGR